MPVESWFPTVVFYEDFMLPPEVRQGVLEAVRERAEPQLVDSGIVVTAMNTPNDLHLDPRLAPLFDTFESPLRKFFFEVMRFDPAMVDFFVGRCWPVVQVDDGQEGVAHHHVGAAFSAVYFLEAPEGSGPLTLYKPFDSPHDPLQKAGESELTFRQTTYQAVENRLILFSSALRHKREPNRGPVGDRVAIAFDVYTMVDIDARTSGFPRMEFLRKLG